MAFTYAQVEAALARLFNADPEVQRKTFRGRIVHLRRVGIPLGFNPGRGKRIAYELEQIYQLALCLELEEFGLDPSLIAKLMERFWATAFYPLMEDAERELGFKLGPEHMPDDVYLAIYPKFMSGIWDHQGGAFSEDFPGLFDLRPFQIEDVKASLSHRRTCTINISQVIRDIRQSLIEVGAASDLPAHLQPGVAEARACERDIRPQERDRHGDRVDVIVNEVRSAPKKRTENTS